MTKLLDVLNGGDLDAALEFLTKLPNAVATISNTFGHLKPGDSFKLWVGDSINGVREYDGTFNGVKNSKVQVKMYGRSDTIGADPKTKAIELASSGAPTFTKQGLAILYSAIESAASVFDEMEDEPSLQRKISKMATKLGIEESAAVVVYQIMMDEETTSKKAMALISAV